MSRARCGVVLRCSVVLCVMMCRVLLRVCESVLLEGKWSGEAMVCGVVEGVLRLDQKRFLMFLAHERRAREEREQQTPCV